MEATGQPLLRTLDPLMNRPTPTTTIASYFEAFSSTHSWPELCAWPPDVFAFTNLVLDHTEAYRFAVSPPAGSTWPPVPGWDGLVTEVAEEWRQIAVRSGESIPDAVATLWDVILDNLDTPLASLRGGAAPRLLEAILTLHATSDETCRGLVWSPDSSPGRAFERRAWNLLAEHGSLSNIDPARVRILPKLHSASKGITIRSFSRYLALTYESVDVHWRRIELLGDMRLKRRDFNILLAPWPLTIEAKAFTFLNGPLENMDPQTFGFFRYDPTSPLDTEALTRLVEEAKDTASRIDALVLPEGAVEAGEVTAVEDLMAEQGVISLMIGVREPPTDTALGRNYVHVAVHTKNGWERYEQPKHHRWCLDGDQIRQYHLSRALDPSKSWWEAIELPARALGVIDVGGGAITAPLVCEDLARMDEVADLLRRIGPSLVVALLLDGPQLPQRWPCRYASVLADEPGSAVLTLSSLGMVTRCRPAGKSRSRIIALWSDPTSGQHQIELAKGCHGVLITASMEPTTVWTADGRRHYENTPTITLGDIHQLKIHARQKHHESIAS